MKVIRLRLLRRRSATQIQRLFRGFVGRKTTGKIKVARRLLYHSASKNTKMVNNFGRGTPDDWIEQNIYSPHSRVGISIMLAINILLFGWVGFLVWAVQMIWIPFWAAGVVNGVGHWWGYRNNETKDKSRNIVPWGIIIGGEELHNNHHLAPANPKLSLKVWEFDIGWLWITIFKHLRLLRVTGPAP
jgi:stearoyl-CoA desaturase (delta-9 desaturase)